MADFVKFAKVRPLPADNIAAYENAVKFVEETKPVAPSPEEAAAQNDKPADKTGAQSASNKSKISVKKESKISIKKGGEK